MKISVAVVLLCVFVIATSAACPWEADGLKKWTAQGFADKTNAITIQKGKAYLFNMDKSPVYEAIHVHGKLIFKNADVHLRTKKLIIHDGGVVKIGSCSCPITKKVQLTFFGERNDPGSNGVGTKGLGVLKGGALHMYGKVRGRTWTKLRETAKAGTKTLKLAQSVNWRVGEKIVIASTDYSLNQAQELTVDKIVDSKTIKVKQALQYEHWGSKFKGVDMRAEVGLLTRHIVLKGNNPIDDEDGFGGHTMYMKGFKAVFISGVEFTRMGQFGELARYPVHWHLAGNVKGKTFLKDCSLHHNFQRAVTVHGTHHAIVAQNVAYETRGHMYFLEDGIERDNSFIYNLGINARRIPDGHQHQLIPSDNRPSVFWITHPDNTYDGNSAAGSERFGFWLAFPVHPTGPSYTEGVWPRRTALKRFSHNTAHSSAGDGLFVDDGENNASGESNAWIPTSNPNVDDWRNNRKAKEAVFEGCHFYKNGNRGVWIRGGMTTVSSSFFSDNAIGITFATNAHIGRAKHNVFVGESPNKGDVTYCGRHCDESSFQANPRALPKPWNEAEKGRPGYPIRGFEFYDGPVSVENCKFWNYKWNSFRKAGCLSMLRADEFGIAPSNDAKGIFVMDNSVPVHFPDLVHDGDYASVFVDKDGTVTGRPPKNGEKTVVTNNNPFLKTESCKVDSKGEVFHCPDHFAGLGINTVFQSAPSTYPATVFKLYRDDKPNKPLNICAGRCEAGNKGGTSATTTLIRNRDYTLHFNTKAPHTVQLTYRYVDLWWKKGKGKPNDIIIGICFPQGTTVTGVRWNYKDLDLGATEANSRSAMVQAPLDLEWSTRGTDMWFHQSSTGYVFVRMIPSQERTNSNKRYAYPAGDVRIQVQLPNGYNGSKPQCTPRDANQNEFTSIPPKNGSKVPDPIDLKEPSVNPKPVDFGSC